MSATPSLWQSFSSVTRFSLIGFLVAAALSIFSIGILGLSLYYPVAPLLPYTIDDLHGDSTWPAIIMAGLAWSVGFLLAALVLHYSKRLKSRWAITAMYIFVLWIWDYVVWFVILYSTLANNKF